MKIIVTMEGKEDMMFDIEKSQSIHYIKLLVHEKHGTEIGIQTVLHDGKEVASAKTLEEVNVHDMDSLTLNVRVDNKTENLVEPYEIERTIVVTDIPCGDKAVTEDEIVRKFSVYGDIARLIVQGEPDANQHAVIIYANAEAVDMAITFDGELLGGAVTVVAASQLPNAVKAEQDKGSEKVKNLIAQGVMMGKKGASTVKEFDERHQISLKVKAGAEMAKLKAKELDDQYKISAKVAAAGSKANEIDHKYGISQKAASAVNAATEKTKEVSEKAMKNENVAAGVQKIGSIFNSFKQFSAKSIDDVKHRMQQMDIQKNGSPKSGAASSSPKNVSDSAKSEQVEPSAPKLDS